jgi:hypothetical protein
MPPRTPENKSVNPEKITPEELLARFEDKRIQPDNRFESLYSDFASDMQRVNNLKTLNDSKKTPETMLGPVGEALVFDLIEKGILGSSIKARGTSIYDDYFHHADLIVEQFGQKRDPMISTIDVTFNQRDIKAVQRSTFEGGNPDVRPVGLEQKISRIKNHIDFLASFSRNDAITLSSWLQSGGLHQKKDRSNDKLFSDAERLMLLKYYVDPEWVDEPKPHFVSAGPQIVISMDTMFLNKALSTEGETQRVNIGKIESLVQAESLLSVAFLNNYLESRFSSNDTGNILLDGYRVATKAWATTFSSPVNEVRMQNAVAACLKDQDLSKQMTYYKSVLEKSFLDPKK